MPDDRLAVGVHEALLTERLTAAIASLDGDRVAAALEELDAGSAADRIARHLAPLIREAIDGASDEKRAERAVAVADAVLAAVEAVNGDLAGERPARPARMLRAVQELAPDGKPRLIEAPMTPLLDTTILTNAPGEPAVGRELRAEIASADSIDLVMAFIRWTGVRPLIEAIRRHCDAGKRLRILTTTYTGSTEQAALEALREAGAEIKVSYDVSQTRLHAKAWIFLRDTGYSTAYLGSSNLTHSAQVTGLEWNVRLSGKSNPDALAKMVAVFETYWAGTAFVAYASDEFAERTSSPAQMPSLLSPVEIELRPFQEQLVEQLAAAREHGHHRNLLVAATGTGKTVMAAVDYARLRRELPRDRLLFIAHRKEILEQSLLTYRHALRDPSFGELWVGGERPRRFDHVFASVQALDANGVASLAPDHFDVVVVDEFHHAPAPSYERILRHVEPRELLGLTATPERADGLDVLAYFDGRIAAELRLWDAIDQQFLSPFAYYGVHDGLDLREIPWRRGRGYDMAALTQVMTADHVWARRVIEKVTQYVGDPRRMRALGFCASIAHARFMAERFTESGIASAAVSGETDAAARAAALRNLRDGSIHAIFSVDVFNEGVDVRDVDTLLLLRPTDSAVLYIQQLGRGLRKLDGKVCTVLDFVANHRREFRFDRRFRALVGGSRRDVERQVQLGFPFLPAGCHLELEPVAQEIVLRSLREALPTDWRSRRDELVALGDVDLQTYLDETGLELEDLYGGGRSWSSLRRAAGVPTLAAGPREDAILRGVGRMLHVDDAERLDAYRALLDDHAARAADLTERERRLLRMAAASLGARAGSLDDAVDDIRAHPQALSEFGEVLGVLSGLQERRTPPIEVPGVPLRLHARYTRTEILAAFEAGDGVRVPEWREGVRWDDPSRSDIFAFTLDKSGGGFSPTTRYRDYAISPRLIHWESQSGTSSRSPVGQRYITHREVGTNIFLFARLRADERAFWFLGPATYVSHDGERPVAFVWELAHALPPDLFTAFAAAAA